MDLNNIDFEISKIVETINSNNYKKIILQLPDGLKQHADLIQEKILEEVDCTIYLWAGSNFGACDIPLELKHLDFDLLVNFGHSIFIKE